MLAPPAGAQHKSRRSHATGPDDCHQSVRTPAWIVRSSYALELLGSDGGGLDSELESDGGGLDSELESDGGGLDSELESDGGGLDSELDVDGGGLEDDELVDGVPHGPWLRLNCPDQPP